MNASEAAAIVRGAYLAWLTHELRLLPVIPIKTSDRAARLSLEAVYVQMRVVERAQIDVFEQFTQGKHVPAEEDQRRAEAQKKLEQSEGVFRLFSDPQCLPKDERPRNPISRMLLIGDAGSGKTTTLHYGTLVLAQRDATRAARLLDLHTHAVPMPVYMRLTLVMKWLRDLPEGHVPGAAIDPLLRWLDVEVSPQVEQFLAAAPVELSPPTVASWQVAIAITPLSALVKAGGCLVLLDGLDETGDTLRREQMQSRISALAETCSHNQYLVASRPFAGIKIPGFVERHLSPLNGSEMQELLGKWFDTASSHDRSLRQQRNVNVKDEVAYLWAILEATPRLFDMCTNPLLLTSVALLVYTGVGLPRQRAELYSRLVALLLETWRVLQLSGGRLPESQAARPELFGENVNSVQDRLQQLADWMQVGERREATLEEITQQLVPNYVADMEEWTEAEAEAYVTQLIESLALDSGILQRRDSGFSFAHYTLQEYLTARDYEWRADGPGELLRRAREPRWREVILLAVGHWAASSGGVVRARKLLDGLLSDGSPELLLLAGDALDDADAARVPALVSRLRTAIKQLRALAFDPAACPDARLRNQAAGLLDRLGGDEGRPGLDLAGEGYWAARIEPGLFSMGDNNGNWDDEKPQFDCAIRRPYALARYPVTNRQYLVFVEAMAGGGPPEAVAAARELLKLMERHEQTPEQFRPEYWPGARYRAGEGNHPVVGVTWYAASAYAWWAEAYLKALGRLGPGEALRLPTEAEWERAAAYSLALAAGDTRAGRREHPWGDWDLTDTTNGSKTAAIRANTSESGIGGTSAVGIFPQGAADCGAEELAGNVWEWCSTPKLEYPFKGEVSAESLHTKNKRASRSYVLRGGSWAYGRDDDRCASRLDAPPGIAHDVHGLRLACLFSLS